MFTNSSLTDEDKQTIRLLARRYFTSLEDVQFANETHSRRLMIEVEKFRKSTTKILGLVVIAAPAPSGVAEGEFETYQMDAEALADALLTVAADSQKVTTITLGVIAELAELIR